jgi:hypothetical protein
MGRDLPRSEMSAARPSHKLHLIVLASSYNGVLIQQANIVLIRELPSMATYREIQNRVRAVSGFVPKTSWIAHVKADRGLSERAAVNRFKHPTRVNPCPTTRRAEIEAALRHFGMV